MTFAANKNGYLIMFDAICWSDAEHKCDGKADLLGIVTDEIKANGTIPFWDTLINHENLN